MINVSLYSLTGKGYEHGWWKNCRCRYRCYKGARNTKKSVVIEAYEILDKILEDERRNVLVIRQTFSSLKTSVFNTLCQLINNFDMSNRYYISLASVFKINKTELTITRIKTGQVILFRGMDDPMKLTSIRVQNGFLTDCYVEEAFEVDSWEDFRKVDGSLRLPEYAPPDLFIQITFCFNAWSKKTFLYDVFFKGRMEDNVELLDSPDVSYLDYKNEDEYIVGGYGKGIYLHTSTYKINEFRSKDYDVAMNELKNKAYDIYLVEGLGCWGNATGATYSHFSENLVFTVNTQDDNFFIQRINRFAIGIDTGLSNGEGKIVYDKNMRYKSATTMILCGLTRDSNTLVALNEYFWSNQGLKVPKTEPEIMDEIIKTILEWQNKYWFLVKQVINVYVDCADIGFRQGLELKAREYQLYNIRFIGSTKIKIQTRVDFINLIMAYESLKICSSCENLIREIKNSQKGENGEPREDFDDHTINAWEYARTPIIGEMRYWKSFKEH